MKLRNIWLVIIDQGPPLRFITNFFITRNAWGLFYESSHIRAATNSPKVTYNTKLGANAAGIAMSRKFDKHFSAYKCLHCDGYHLGKNRDNK